MYNLDTLPYKTLLHIINTGDSTILGDNHKEQWEKLYKSYKKLFGDDKNFDVQKQISVLELRQKILALSVEALKFDNNKEIIEVLKKVGYSFNSDSYESEIKRLETSLKSISPKIEKAKAKLPKGSDVNIDEIIISYCSILGVTFDTNKVTVTQFHAMQETVKKKIEITNNK